MLTALTTIQILLSSKSINITQNTYTRPLVHSPVHIINEEETVSRSGFPGAQVFINADSAHQDNNEPNKTHQSPYKTDGLLYSSQHDNGHQ